MRDLNRNKKTIYYALYTGKSESTDLSGDYTGEQTLSYSDIKPFRIHMKEAQRIAPTEPFGVYKNYTHRMATHDLSCPIDEKTILWVDKFPSLSEYNASAPYEVGAFVEHNGKPYECTASITSEAWNGSHWTEVKHNYVVEAVSRSINVIAYDVREVSVG